MVKTISPKKPNQSITKFFGVTTASNENEITTPAEIPSPTVKPTKAKMQMAMETDEKPLLSPKSPPKPTLTKAKKVLNDVERKVTSKPDPALDSLSVHHHLKQFEFHDAEEPAEKDSRERV